jgi:hypothetical protein
VRETLVVDIEDPSTRGGATHGGWTHVASSQLSEPAPKSRLREGMKWYDAEHRYVRCELMICTEPTQDSDLQVFGLFVLDRLEPCEDRRPYLVAAIPKAAPLVPTERKTGGQAYGSGNSPARSGRARVAPAGGLNKEQGSLAGPESRPGQ